MQYYAFSQLLNFLSLLFLGLFILLYNIKNKVNQTYALLNFSMAFWALFYYLWMTTQDHATSFFYLKALESFACFIPVTFLHFVFNYTETDKFKKIFLPVMYVYCLFCLVINNLNLMFHIMRPKLVFIWWPDADLFYSLFLIYFYIGVVMSFYLMIRSYQKAQGSYKNRLKYFIPAAALATIAGSFNFFLWYNIPIPPLLNPLITLYAAIVAYTMFRHHLMDINIVVRKGLIYSAVIASVTGLYVAFLTFLNQFILYGNANIKHMAPYVFMLPVQSFVSGVAVLLVGIYVFINNARSKINIIFFLFCLSAFVWLFSFSMMYSNQSINKALIWARYGDVGILCLPIFSYYFVLVLLHKDNGFYLKLLQIMLILSTPILYLTQTEYFFTGIQSYSWGHYPLAGPLYALSIMFYFLYVLSIYLLYYSLISKSEQYDTRKINQIKYVLIAFVGGCTGFVDFLPKYHVPIYPWGHISSLIFIFIIAYTILKHRLMDVVVVIRKGLLYSFIAGLLTALYLSLVFIFGNYLGGRKSAASIFFTIISIIIFSLIFQPLRDKVQEIIDKLFFRGKYDYQKTLKELSLTARSIAGIDELSDKVLSSIADIIKIDKASIYVLDKRSNKYSLRRAIGDSPVELSSEIFTGLSNNKEPIMFDNISRTFDPKYAIVFPFISKDKLVGVMCLGDKLSGEVYSDDDIDLLATLCNQMGVSIENAMLYEDALESQKQLYQADKLATVGALAAGLAHEIKNPIAAIKGFSQVLDKAMKEKDAEAIKDFKEVVPRQLDRINEIVERLLKLSKPPKPEMGKVNLNVIVDEVVKLIEKQAIKQKVEIKKELGDIPEVIGDAGQLSQAMLNLLLNAVQSMPEGGTVWVKSHRTKDSVTVEIKDSGQGIPRSFVTRIFDPFYTTKAGGSGLGLAVTRKIVIDHHGSIKVESEEGHGATFTIELPFIVENGQSIA